MYIEKRVITNMNIKKQIIEIIKNCLELDELNLSNNDNLIDNLSINSIDAIGIFISIEDTFGIQIEDEELGVELIESIDSITNYVKKRLKNVETDSSDF